MEQPELQTERIHEELHEHAQHSNSRFISGVALSSALIAALAAVTASMAGHYANDAMVEQIESTDKWAQYQAKSIKSTVVQTRIVVLEAIAKPVDEADREKLKDYDKDQKDIQEEAIKLKHESETHLKKHQTLSVGLTLYQVAIAVGAISALTRRPRFWFVSLAFAALATAFLILGLV